MILESPKPRHVCWRPREIQPFESAWSLLQKFCRWNRALHQDAWELFAVPEKRFVPGHPARLFSRGMIDRKRMAHALGLSLEEVNDGFVDRFLADGRYSTEDRLSSPNVRVCPECITRGYHSALHDILFIPACVVHNEPLQDACPRCGQVLRRALPTATRDTTFSCSCGHILWPGDRVHVMTDDETNRVRETAAWLLRVKREAIVPLYRFVTAPSETSILSRHIGVLSEFMADIDVSLKPPTFLVTPQRRSAAKAVRTLHIPKAARTVQDHDLLSVYKAVARRLTRRVRRRLKRRYPRARTFTTALHERIQGDPENIALFAWRAYWEGVSWHDWNRILTGSRAGRDRWRDAVLNRFVELFGKQPNSNQLGVSDLHFLASACLGTLLECCNRTGEAQSLRDAGRLAAQITGECIPMGMERMTPLRDRLIHLWIPQSPAGLPILR